MNNNNHRQRQRTIDNELEFFLLIITLACGVLGGALLGSLSADLAIEARAHTPATLESTP